MKPNFEEKTYESFFNSALDRNSSIYFPIGQAQEGSLGFDSSSFSRNRKLWGTLGYSYYLPRDLPFSGVELEEIATYMTSEINSMPKMKANLLFQYKRSELLKSPTAKEWSYWKQPYFRYDIYDEQQKLLEQIHTQFGSKVHVLYAAPVIIDKDKLVEVRKDIINYSNFTRAIDLKGHHKNTFIKAGTYSIACSEPNEIEKVDILKLLEEIENDSDNADLTNEKFIIDFSKKMKNIILESEYKKAFNNLEEDLFRIKEYEILYGFSIMNIFKVLTGVQWLVK